MVVKSSDDSHALDLQELFDTIRKYQLKLNPEKCSFGVQAGKFLGFMLTHRGIEANPERCSAIINMRSPSSVKEVQQLTGRVISLSRFLSKVADKALPLFSCLKKKKRFTWSDECKDAFGQLKECLGSPPILSKPVIGLPLLLYVVVSDQAMSTVLAQEDGEQKPVYFISKVFKGPEVRYNKIEKVALAILATARKLRHYFHQVIVRTDQPIRQVLHKPDLAGQMMKWSVELSEFGLRYEPRGPIKSQILADFILELTSPNITEVQERPWILSVDGSSNLKGSGAGIILEGPDGVLIEQSLRFDFKASNNQAEYEALLVGMSLAQEMGVQTLIARSDSQLVTGQVTGTFQAKDPQLARYLEKVKEISASFTTFSLSHVPRDQNSRANLLSKLASTKKSGSNQSVIQETLKKPNIHIEEIDVLFLQEEHRSWMGPIIAYLEHGTLPTDADQAKKLIRDSAQFTILGGKLYRGGFNMPFLRCLAPSQWGRVIAEIHEGVCGSHIGGRSLANKVLRAGYFWPSLKADCTAFVKRCDRCQKHSNLHTAPAETLQSVLSPWPFNRWGIDILGPFPIAVRQLKFLIVVVDYFTKWVEAEPIATISAERVKYFMWKSIVCRFGVPYIIVADNGTQFASSRVQQFCRDLGIKMLFTSVEYPQSNGQAEEANKVKLSGLKKCLQDAKTNWVDNLSQVLWLYHTTPHSSTHETPFRLVYETDAVIPIEIGEPSFRVTSFSEEGSEEGRRADLDILGEIQGTAHIQEAAAKSRAVKKYNSRVLPRSFKQGDLVLKKAQPHQISNKLSPRWIGPYRILQVVGNGAYKLQTLDGGAIPRTWNATNLRFYYS
uniref:Retrovirus-related Pol polyprotein from transposon 17.6 n=1 Tax=Cajanus cajan TaxID=3821 RepID=A0A151SC61_CAJCA|nr:Retrovirus-related Pol polyprotein from transposon 17.6 [Cajanus cajan]